MLKVKIVRRKTAVQENLPKISSPARSGRKEGRGLASRLDSSLYVLLVCLAPYFLSVLSLF